MKKRGKEEKRLSLNKMQMMKASQMKTIRGAFGITRGFNEKGSDDPPPTPFQTASGK